MINMFDSFGFATDPFLGNLTVSPKNLGTGMRLFVEFETQATEEPLDRVIEMDLLHRSHIKYERHSNTSHSLTTMKTLSAGYNEMV